MNTGSNETFFGLGRGRLTDERVAQLSEIAARHGASFTYANLPGEGLRYWFAGPNRGEPFDRDLARTVLADVERAGINIYKGR